MFLFFSIEIVTTELQFRIDRTYNMGDSKMKKRIISMLMAVCMLVSLLPTWALAEEPEEPAVRAVAGKMP